MPSRFVSVVALAFVLATPNAFARGRGAAAVTDARIDASVGAPPSAAASEAPKWGEPGFVPADGEAPESFRVRVAKFIKNLPFQPNVQATDFLLNPKDGTIDLVVKDVSRDYTTRMSDSGMKDLLLWGGEPFALGNDGVLRGLNRGVLPRVKYQLRFLAVNTLLGGAGIAAAHALILGYTAAQFSGTFVLPMFVAGVFMNLPHILNTDFMFGLALAGAAAYSYPANMLAQFARRVKNNEQFNGFNFFTKKIAKNVAAVSEVNGDVMVQFENGKVQRLGALVKREPKGVECKRWLTKFAG